MIGLNRKLGPEMPDVAERVIVITGGARGLGRAHALAFAARGARVVVNDLGTAPDGRGADATAAEEVAAEITATHGRAVADHHDISTPDGGAAVVQTAIDAFGRVDVVVNNAGILRDAAFHNMTPQQWEAVRRVHLDGTFHVTRAAWPHMREQRFGRVVMTTSGAGIYGNFGQANYGAAKLGMVGLMNVLAIEGARYGITVNAIAPVAATRMTEGLMGGSVDATDLDPAWVSPVVVWLATEECDLTGEIVRTKGGHYARIRTLESRGVDFPQVPTVEELAARWDDISDMSRATEGHIAIGR